MFDVVTVSTILSTVRDSSSKRISRLRCCAAVMASFKLIFLGCEHGENIDYCFKVNGLSLYLLP